jgi:Phage integrase family
MTPVLCCRGSSRSWRSITRCTSQHGLLWSGCNRRRRCNQPNGRGDLASYEALLATAPPSTHSLKFRRRSSCRIDRPEPDPICTPSRKCGACWKRPCNYQRLGRRRRCDPGSFIAFWVCSAEALLKLDDVDIEQGVLTIRAAKFGRARFVPLHPSTRTVLIDYLQRRKQFLGNRPSNYVFVSYRGTRLDLGRVHRAFHALSRQTGLRAPGARNGPRLHDFRHRFAVQVLARWYESGEDPARRLPILSTYFGHVCVAGTYWYLSRIVARRDIVRHGT